MILRATATAAVLTVLVTGTLAVNNTQDAAVASLASSVHLSKVQLQSITAANPARTALIASVNAQIEAATGKVLDPSIIAAAKTQTAQSETVVAAASRLAASDTAAISRGVTASQNALPSEITANAVEIGHLQTRPTLDALSASDAELQKTIESLKVGVSAWTAQQAQIAAAQKAAADAVAASAVPWHAPSAAAFQPSTSSPPARGAGGFVVHVWTSGFQTQIDQCRGAVDVTAVYKVHVIAEHDGCGGNLFPTAAGSIVTITGLDAGRYRVIGVVARLNGLVNHAEDIPRGYDLLFQTCVGGFTDMLFTALSRLG